MEQPQLLWAASARAWPPSLQRQVSPEVMGVLYLLQGDVQLKQAFHIRTAFLSFMALLQLRMELLLFHSYVDSSVIWERLMRLFTKGVVLEFQ